MRSIDFKTAQQEILEVISDSIHLAAHEINLDRPLSDFPLDSLDAINLLATIEGIVQQELPVDVMTRDTCLRDVFAMLRDKLTAA